MPDRLWCDPNLENRAGEITKAFRKLIPFDRPTAFAHEEPGLARSCDDCAMQPDIATDRVDKRRAESASIDITFLRGRSIQA